MTFGRGFMVHHSRPGRDRGNRRGRTRRPTEGRSEACPYRGSDGGHYRRGAPRGRPQAELYGGGEGGIRTHGPLARSRALQARLIGHSSTSPLSNWVATDSHRCNTDSPSVLVCVNLWRSSCLAAVWWRRGWDSNPRYACAHTAFRERHHQPLGHPSVPIITQGRVRLDGRRGPPQTWPLVLRPFGSAQGRQAQGERSADSVCASTLRLCSGQAGSA